MGFSAEINVVKKEGPGPMCRYAIAVLCLVGLFASPVLGQKTGVEPIHATTGTVLTFYVQTRLQANNGNEADALAKGTVIYVKLLDSIDSSLDRDGAEFHGVVVSPILSGDAVIVHAESEVQGL
jgi:hypothetical protein